MLYFHLCHCDLHSNNTRGCSSGHVCHWANMAITGNPKREKRQKGREGIAGHEAKTAHNRPRSSSNKHCSRDQKKKYLACLCKCQVLTISLTKPCFHIWFLAFLATSHLLHPIHIELASEVWWKNDLHSYISQWKACSTNSSRKSHAMPASTSLAWGEFDPGSDRWYRNADKGECACYL